jgi:hypothetical protein
MKTVNNKVEYTEQWAVSQNEDFPGQVTIIEKDGNGRIIAVVDDVDEQDKYNAAFIVKAVNNYYPMLEALKIAREYVMHMKTKGAIGEIDKDLFKIESAIKQAEQ